MLLSPPPSVYVLISTYISGADGTFDILKYADPDLDLGSDNKTIFDDLVEDSKPQESDEKPEKSEFPDIKTQPKTETDGKY